MGLIEIAEPNENANFRLLTDCVICMVKPSVSVFRLNKNGRRIWTWIKYAGFKLTISELVYIMDRDIKAGLSFFGKDNWHTLIHAIYTPDTISDRILETMMEESPARNSTVLAVLGLLQKKFIILV